MFLAVGIGGTHPCYEAGKLLLGNAYDFDRLLQALSEWRVKLIDESKSLYS
jgi:hypothetical protein